MNKNNIEKFLLKLENRVKYKLIKRYDKSISFHGKKKINDILFNKKSHYVEEFKEYLIYEDYNEFLKRYYSTSEIKIKLQNILNFYEKYSKIYANYTVIPESKYMYKNIKRKQKMIDQMQNNNQNNNNSEFEESESDDEDMTNTIFKSYVMNSIYSKSVSTLNKSVFDKNTKDKDISINSILSINKLLSRITNIEKNQTINSKLTTNNYTDRGKKDNISINNKKTKKDPPIVKKLPIEFVTSKLSLVKKFNKNFSSSHYLKPGYYSNRLCNADQKPFSKIIDLQIEKSNKQIDNVIKTNRSKDSNNLNTNNPNKKNSKKNSKINNDNISNNKSKYNNCVFICNNSISVKNENLNHNYCCKYKNKKKSLSSNASKQLIASSLLKHNSSKNNNNNPYLLNINNNLDLKYKLNLEENISMKCDKKIPSANTSYSPKLLINSVLSSPISQGSLGKKKHKNKPPNYHKKQKKVTSSSKQQTNSKKSNLINNFNSIGNDITFLSSKLIDFKKLKVFANNILKKKANKKLSKKLNPCHKAITNSIMNYITYSNKQIKEPETHRDYHHKKMLSARNSKPKDNSWKNQPHNFGNMKNKCKTKTKLITKKNKTNNIKLNSNKIISGPASPNNSSSNGFYYLSNNINYNNTNICNNKCLAENSQAISINNKNININNNNSKNLINNIENNKKNKIVNNYNIVNNMNDNSTQINIYTGNELYKSLHLNNNQTSTTSSVYLLNNNMVGATIKPIKGIPTAQSSNANSNSKKKEKNNKYNLDLKKILHKHIGDSERDTIIISAREMANKKLFEKLGTYFSKNKSDNKHKDTYFNNKLKNTKHISNNNTYYFNNSQINMGDNKKNTILSNNNSTNKMQVKKMSDTPAKNSSKALVNKNFNQRRVQSYGLIDNEQIKRISRRTCKQTLNHKLTKLKYMKKDDDIKFVIHSERNKNSKIVFK